MRFVNGASLLKGLLLGAFFLLLGCATIIHGTKQDVSISSDPPRANLKVVGAGGLEMFNGVTPAVVTLSRKSEYDVFISMDGYKEQRVHISKEFDAWYLGNLLCGGIIGLIIDAANGAMNKLSPEVINVTMATAYNEDGTREFFAVFQTLDAEGQVRSLAVPFIKS